MRRAALCALVAVALIGASSSASALTETELMTMLAGVTSSRARFVETRQSTMLKKPLVLSGRLIYRRPDRLEKHVQTPYQETIVIEGSRVLVMRQGSDSSRVVALPASGPAQALIESLRATLAGDLAALERHFTVGVAGTRGDWTLKLVPRDAALGAIVLSVGFAGSERRVQRIEVVEAGGDRTVTTISDDDR